MPQLRPFRALRYAPEAGDAGDLLAPPFDVIGPEEAAELRARHPCNAVRLVLPEEGGAESAAGEGEAPGRYERAARRLREWRDRDVLVRDPEPAVYLYRQRFRDRDGAERTRSALIAALRLVPLTSGDILPHEETHTGPKSDRMALTEATGAQLSPVFLVARDAGGRLHSLVSDALTGPAAEVLAGRTPDGIGHELRRLPAGGLAGEILEAAGSEPLLIADGHHRYETALAFSRRSSSPAGAGWMLACVVSGQDPGLRILPTHRTLSGPPSGRTWGELLDERFVRRELPVEGRAEPADAAAEAARRGGAFMAVLPPAWGIRPRPEAVEEAAMAGVEARLAPVVLDRLLLRAAYGFGPDHAAEAGILSYHRDAGHAASAAGPEGAAFLLPPLSLEAVWEVCAAVGRLPPKSTYFWPKMPSGLLFRPLAD